MTSRIRELGSQQYWAYPVSHTRALSPGLVNSNSPPGPHLTAYTSRVRCFWFWLLYIRWYPICLYARISRSKCDWALVPTVLHSETPNQNGCLPLGGSITWSALHLFGGKTWADLGWSYFQNEYSCISLQKRWYVWWQGSSTDPAKGAACTLIIFLKFWNTSGPDVSDTILWAWIKILHQVEEWI